MKKGFFGCAFLFLFFFVILIVIFISIELPEIDLSVDDTKKNKYEIVTDSLTNEKVINASFSWRFRDNNLRRKKYDLSFRLLEKDVKKAMDHIEQISEMSYRELGVDFGTRSPDPVLEARIVWGEVYRRVYSNSILQMKSIFEGFNKIFEEENLGSKDRVIFVVTFIQNIPYDRPGGVLDLFPPIGTLAYRFGDCDSKALLLYVILEKMNVDCAMLWSYKYKHAMLGVSISSGGQFKSISGKKYYFLETTYPGWQIGDLPPEFKNKRFWFIDEIDSNERTTTDEVEELIEPEVEDSEREARPSPANP
jgi:hypothetical protein